jgi:DDE superfamily endonuclease
MTTGQSQVISRSIYRPRSSHKKWKLFPTKQKALLHTWVQKLAGWHPEQVVFVDESEVNARSGRRTYGWGPKGQPIPHKVYLRKHGNFSVLPSITMDGYIAYCIYPGAVNADTFNEYIENILLPLCSPYPGPKSIIVMDNASMHKSEVYKTDY